MPCIGLTPFLPNVQMIVYLGTLFVSMPCIGLTPFLQIGLNLRKLAKYSVNALYRAYSISTAGCEYISDDIIGVNALYRAYSISTHAGWKPCEIVGKSETMPGIVLTKLLT